MSRQEAEATRGSSEEYQPPHSSHYDDNQDEISSPTDPQHLPFATTNTESHPPTIIKSRNILYTLLFTGFGFAGRSIWQQSVLATYVYLLMNGNAESVGFITAVMGIAQLVASIPTGYIADRYRRDVMLKAASGFDWIAVFVTLWALYEEQFFLLVVALATWGVVWGVASTALGALFADSIPEGERAYYFSIQSILRSLGNTAGPIMALVAFFCLGDTWTLKDCAVVMAVGQCVSFPAMVVLAWLSDDYAVVHRERPSNENDNIDNSLEEPLLREGRNNPVDEEQGFVGTRNDDPERATTNNSRCHGEDHIFDNQTLSATSQSESSSSTSSTQQQTEYAFGCIPRNRLAPILVAAADMTSGLASGMSIRYFPIFFVDSLKLSPVTVQILYILSPLLQACFTKTAQRLSQRFGRCQMTILHKWTGISCMVALIVGSQLGLPREWICVIFVVRTALMNSTSALTKSVLMDNVPAHERGRWTVLESVNMFSWSGSAALGGLLVKFDGILFNFGVTATLQFMASLPILALMLTMDVDANDDENNIDGNDSDEIVNEINNDADDEICPGSDQGSLCEAQRTSSATEITVSMSDVDDEISTGYQSP